jgi:hypothetical protein
MSDVFESMDPATRRAFSSAYLRHLEQHDGEIDHHRRRFRAREALFRAIVERPVALRRPLVDQDAFDRNNRPGPIDPQLDPLTLWALTAAKANLSERHAIEIQLARSAGRPVDTNDPQSYIDIEEFYHTRILADVLATIGLTASFGPPPLATRILIAVMIRVPRAIANFVILAAELGGVALFQLLLEKARTLLASEPAALARVEQLFAQIIADEIGHVLFVRSRLGRVRLWLAQRFALPIVAVLMRHDMPEIDRLFGRGTLRARMDRTDLRSLRRIHPDRGAAATMFATLGVDATPAEPVAETA